MARCSVASTALRSSRTDAPKSEMLWAGAAGASLSGAGARRSTMGADPAAGNGSSAPLAARARMSAARPDEGSAMRAESSPAPAE